MEQHEQPDSTTHNDNNNLISLDEEPVSGGHAKDKGATEILKPEVKGVSGCPACNYLDTLEQLVPQNVADILTWKDVFKSSIICFSILPLLIMYSYCNPLVVSAYLLLGLTTSTFTYRLYRYVLDSFQKSEVTHPFKSYSDLDESKARAVINEYTDKFLPLFIRMSNKLKSYILVDDMKETVKFAVALYLTAVIGGFFSLRLLLILAFAGAFSLPKVYITYKPQIQDAMQKVHVAVEQGIKQAKMKVNSLRQPAADKKDK